MRMKKGNNRHLLTLVALVLLTILAGCRTGRNTEDKAARIKKQQQYEQLAELSKFRSSDRCIISARPLT